MVIHPDKTKSMIIAPRQKLQLTKPKLNLTLGTSIIEEVKEHKMLGLIVDNNLTWNKHIENMIKQEGISLQSSVYFFFTKLFKGNYSCTN